MDDFKYRRRPSPHDTTRSPIRPSATRPGLADRRRRGRGAGRRSGGREIPVLPLAGDPDQGDFCTHRDVLPFAGKEGFKPESWCPECAFYKLRRTPKKRERIDYCY